MFLQENKVLTDALTMRCIFVNNSSKNSFLALAGLRMRTTTTVSMYQDSVVQSRTRSVGTMTSKASALQTRVTSVPRYLTEAGGTISASLPTSMECIIRLYINKGKMKSFQDIKN